MRRSSPPSTAMKMITAMTRMMLYSDADFVGVRGAPGLEPRKSRESGAPESSTRGILLPKPGATRLVTIATWDSMGDQLPPESRRCASRRKLVHPRGNRSWRTSRAGSAPRARAARPSGCRASCSVAAWSRRRKASALRRDASSSVRASSANSSSAATRLISPHSSALLAGRRSPSIASSAARAIPTRVGRTAKSRRPARPRC